MRTAQMAVPKIAELPSIGAVLDSLQTDGPLHLHTGDLGWYSLRGAGATAQSMRVWRCEDKVLAIGLLDGENLLRLAVDPDFRHDDSLARRIECDIDPSDSTFPPTNSAVFGKGTAIIKAQGAARLVARLAQRGWDADEPWTPLSRNLSLPIGAPGCSSRWPSTVTTRVAATERPWRSLRQELCSSGDLRTRRWGRRVRMWPLSQRTHPLATFPAPR